MTTPVAATTSNGTFSGTSASVTQPTVVNAGDLLIIFLGGDGENGVSSWPTGYNELYNTGSNGCFAAAAWKDADGTEDSVSVTVNLVDSEIGGWQCYRITGAGDPAVYPPFISSVSQGDSSSPTPSSVTPPGTKDFLYLIHGGFDRASYITSAPTGYGSIVTSTQTGAQDGNSSVCEKSTTASSSDTPDAASTNTADGFNIYTIAIEDGSGVLHEGDLTAAGIATVVFTPVATWSADLTAAVVGSMSLPSSVEHPGNLTAAGVATLFADSQNFKEGTLTVAGVATVSLTGQNTLSTPLTINGVATQTTTAQNFKNADLTAAMVSTLSVDAQNFKNAVVTLASTGAMTASVIMGYAGTLSVTAPASVVFNAKADYIVQLDVYAPASFSRLYGGFNIFGAITVDMRARVAPHGTRIRKPIIMRVTKAGLWTHPPRS